MGHGRGVPCSGAGVKLWIESRTVGRPSLARASSSAAIASWYGRWIAAIRCARAASSSPSLPGMGTPPLTTGMALGACGGRLQSTTSRE